MHSKPVKIKQQNRRGLDKDHWLINFKDTKAKCRHLKHRPQKGLCGRCLSKFRYKHIDAVSLVGIFDSALWNVAPLIFSLVQLSPPFTVWKHSLYRQCVAGKGGGCWILLVTIFCWSLTVSDQIQNLQNCQITPNKNLGGEGTTKYFYR